eukprot:gene9217-19115_t
MVDVQYTSPQTLCKREPFFKRRRQDDIFYGDNENMHPQSASLDRMPEKRARRSSCGPYPEEAEVEPVYSQRDMARVQQEFDNHINNLRLETQRALSEKDFSLQEMQNTTKLMMDTVQLVQQQNQKLDEENKLFKRAIGIQEGRYRELGLQHQQIRDALGQAIEYVANLERANASLKDHLRQMNGPEFISYQPPPDVC